MPPKENEVAGVFARAERLARFYRRLFRQAPAGILPRPEAEVRQGDYLEVVEYSAFQVDPMGGDIAGEIRLGYLHQGGEIRIVSGGSVTGQMADAIPTMTFSSETEQYDNFVIPRVTRLKNLKITGVE